MKKFATVLAVCLVLPFFLFGCDSSDEIKNFYSIKAVFDEENMTLSCEQKVTYANTSNEALDEVDFFLYPNAFAQGQTPVAISSKSKAYPNGESFGGIELKSVSLANVETEFFVEGQSKNILVVKLANELFPNEKVEIEMEYVVSLANINHRLGYGEKTVNFGNFFPIACVYENGFVKNEFSTNGDPFYSDVADFEVELTFPEDYVLASSGNRQSLSAGHAVCSAQNVRDFCFVLSKEFEVISREVGGVTVNFYFYEEENPQALLEVSCKALDTFSSSFGDYPYAQLSVVKTNFCYGGMEYPNLVMIADDLSDDEEKNYVIVHEIAHQWWYGVVGNNEFSDAWVDEGLTEYSTVLFFEQNAEYGVKYDTVIVNAYSTYKKFVEVYSSVLGDVDESMNRDLTQFATEPEYVNCTYTKGVLLFDSLRESVGKKKLEKCLKNYYKNYKFKNSSYEKLVQSFCNSSGRNLENFFDSWATGKVKIG
jgi:hypothetical protein